MRIQLLLLPLLYLSCSTQSPDMAEEPPVMVYMLEDFSGTRSGVQPLEAEFAEEIIQSLIEVNRAGVVRFAHVSQPHSNPVSCEIEAFTGTLDEFDLDYRVNLGRRDSITRQNEEAIEKFKVDFTREFIGFRKNLTSENDYSYCNNHLRTLAAFLADTTLNARKIVVVSTDFINHHPKGRPKPVDENIYSQLNNALAVNPNATLYVITDISREGTTLKKLDATYLGNWIEFKVILHNILKSL